MCMENAFRNNQNPPPPLSVQQEIVLEIDGYQKIVDGAKQIVENYKPKIKIDESWAMVELGELFKRGHSKWWNAFKGRFLNTGMAISLDYKC